MKSGRCVGGILLAICQWAPAESEDQWVSVEVVARSAQVADVLSFEIRHSLGGDSSQPIVERLQKDMEKTKAVLADERARLLQWSTTAHGYHRPRYSSDKPYSMFRSYQVRVEWPHAERLLNRLYVESPASIRSLRSEIRDSDSLDSICRVKAFALAREEAQRLADAADKTLVGLREIVYQPVTTEKRPLLLNWGDEGGIGEGSNPSLPGPYRLPEVTLWRGISAYAVFTWK